MPPSAVIRKVGAKYILFTKDGTRRLGTYDTREEAEKRERQVEYFKHQGRAGSGIDPYLAIGEPGGGSDQYDDDEEDPDANE